MSRSVFSIVLFALIGHLCVTEIATRTSKPKHLTDIYNAAIDILMTCNGDPGSAVGIVGDSDGSVLKALRSKHFIPVVSIDHMIDVPVVDFSKLHELQLFIIAADSIRETFTLMDKLRYTVWWNQYAHFIFVDTTDNYASQCSVHGTYMHIQIYYGLINAQFVCNPRSIGVLLINSNQFTSQAPPVWKFMRAIRLPGAKRLTSIFVHHYQKGGKTCEALNFPKTLDIGGWPIRFESKLLPYLFDETNPKTQKYFNHLSNDARTLYEAIRRDYQWFMDNIVMALNATAVIVSQGANPYEGGIIAIGVTLEPNWLSPQAGYGKATIHNMIVPLFEKSMFAVTKHTGDMTQLEKVLSVIDGTSRIGIWVVYLITFLFFKFFLGQAVMPAILNLVRLTCNTGIQNLPHNLAPKIYLACLLMFVVTLQGSYSGNLATLFTTKIAYRNVQTKRDIPYLGYTLYTPKGLHDKLVADPMLEGHVIEIPKSGSCLEYVLKKPLAVCVHHEDMAIYNAMRSNLHISKDPMVHDQIAHSITAYNPLGRRLETIMRRWGEHNLLYANRDVEKIRLRYVDDDKIMKNTERRAMNLDDLSFAFVILGIGLLCALVCFIGEIMICEIRLEMAKQRNRIRRQLAWGVNKNSFFSFRSFNF